MEDCVDQRSAGGDHAEMRLSNGGYGGTILKHDSVVDTQQRKVAAFDHVYIATAHLSSGSGGWLEGPSGHRSLSRY